MDNGGVEEDINTDPCKMGKGSGNGGGHGQLETPIARGLRGRLGQSFLNTQN